MTWIKMQGAYVNPAQIKRVTVMQGELNIEMSDGTYNTVKAADAKYVAQQLGLPDDAF
jgi:hypothetical protein